ncbi:hypothetical protein D9M68_749100 [compost metagenome]
MLGQLDGHYPRGGDDAAFGSGVSGATGEAHESGSRGDIDDPAAPTEHSAGRRLSDQAGTEQVDAQHALELCGLGLDEWLVEQDTCTVDQDVDGAPLGHDAVDHIADLSGISYIEDAGHGRLTEFVGQRLGCL